MIQSEVRTHVAANEPVSAKGADGPDEQATNDVAASPPPANRPEAAPGRLRPPWLVRNSRKVKIALALAILAASPFAYRYLDRNFGPDPLAGIKIDAVRFDSATGTFEVVKPAEVKSADAVPAGAKPAMARPVAVAKPAEPAPKPVPPQSSTSPAAQFPASPVAPASGVTHTRSAVAAPVRQEPAAPVSAIPYDREAKAKPRASAREQQTVSGACTEVVAALGFCDPNAPVKDK